MSTCCSDLLVDCHGSDLIIVIIDRRGGFAPYLTLKVKIKVRCEIDISLRGEPVVKTTVKLMRYTIWLGMGGKLIQFLTENIKYYTKETFLGLVLDKKLNIIMADL